MLRSENVATPPPASTTLVPERVAPKVPVPLVIETVTVPFQLVAMFPTASFAVTWTDGVIVRPAEVVEGSCVNSSCAAAPAITANGADTTPGNDAVVAERV